MEINHTITVKQTGHEDVVYGYQYKDDAWSEFVQIENDYILDTKRMPHHADGYTLLLEYPDESLVRIELRSLA